MLAARIDKINLLSSDVAAIVLPLDRMWRHALEDIAEADASVLRRRVWVAEILQQQDGVGVSGHDGPVSLECDGNGVRLMRPALSITSVVELDTLHVVQQTFAPADFVLMHGGRTLRRLGGYSWPSLITVVYLPVPEVDIRDRVIIDLVRLALTYNGQIHQESIGDYSAGGSVTADTYQRERENLLSGISNRRGFRFA